MSLVVVTTYEERTELLAADPETYYITDHYVGVPLVLFGMRRLPEPMARTRHELKEEIAWTKTRLA